MIHTHPSLPTQCMNIYSNHISYSDYNQNNSFQTTSGYFFDLILAAMAWRMFDDVWWRSEIRAILRLSVMQWFQGTKFHLGHARSLGSKDTTNTPWRTWTFWLSASFGCDMNLEFWAIFCCFCAFQPGILSMFLASRFPPKNQGTEICIEKMVKSKSNAQYSSMATSGGLRYKLQLLGAKW